MRIEIDKIIPVVQEIPLTPMQESVLKFLWTARLNNEPLPTHREMVKKLGISSTSEAARHLKSLEKQGFLSRTFKHSRAIQLNEEEIICFYSQVSDSA